MSDNEPATPSTEAERASRHDSKEVVLKVVSPFWTTAFNFTTDEGDTLSVDRNGTSVPRSAVKTIFDAAAKSGVALTEVSD